MRSKERGRFEGGGREGGRKEEGVKHGSLGGAQALRPGSRNRFLLLLDCVHLCGKSLVHVG